MSLLRLPKRNRIGSAWERLWESFYAGEKRRPNGRKPRLLRVDPLEERALLSVTVADLTAQLVASAGSNSTILEVATATDKDGDTIVVWSQLDQVLDENGNVVIDKTTGMPQTDSNIYARYLTNEVQQISLPPEVLTDILSGKYATLSITYGGNEVQQLSISTATIAGDQATPGAVAGTFRLNYVASDGTIYTTEEIEFNETDFSNDDWSTTLSSNLNATSSIVNVANSFISGTNPTLTIQIGLEQMLVTAVGIGQFTVTRGVNGTTAVAHPKGSVVTLVSDWTDALGAAVSDVDTTISVADNSALTAALELNPRMVLQIGSEQMLITAIGTNEFTVVRGYNNTTAAAHAAGDTVTLLGVLNHATRIQAALRNLAAQENIAALSDVVVTAVDSRNFTIAFGDNSLGANQNRMYVTDANWTNGWLPAASVSTVREPVTISGIKISPTSAKLTAQSIQDAFDQLYDTYAIATILNSDMPTNGGLTEVVATLPRVKVTPVNLTTFNIEFIGTTALQNVPLLKIAALKDETGAAIDVATASVVTLKESTDTFRVNPEELDNPFTVAVETYNQYSPSVAIDADGDFVIVWESVVPNSQLDGSKTDIFGRIYTTAGIVDASASGIMVVDMDRDGVPETPIQGVRLVEVASPYSATLSSSDPLRVESDAYTFRVNTLTTNAQSVPSVSMDAEGNFVVAWQSEGQAISYYNDIYVRQFSADGTPRTPVEFQANTTTTEVYTGAATAMSDAGHFLVMWLRNNSLYGELYDAAGSVIREEWLIAQGSAQQPISNPNAAFDSANNYAVCWTQGGMDNDNTAGPSTGVYYILYDITGTTLVATNRVNGGTGDTANWPGSQQNGFVRLDADGDITFVYDGFGPDTAETVGLANYYFVDQIALPENADLLALWPEMENLTLPMGMFNSGDIDSAIEEIMATAQGQFGFNDDQLGRLFAILNNVAGILRGEANGVMYAQYDANPTLGTSSQISGDNVVNSLRDGVNTRLFISVPQIASDGTFSIRIINGMTGLDVVVEIEPVYTAGDPPLVDPEATLGAIEEALQEVLGVNWPEDDNLQGTVIIRMIDPFGMEIGLKDGTYWELNVDIQQNYVYEVTFVGEAHDSPIVAGLVGSSLVDPDDNPVMPDVSMYCSGDPGTIQTVAGLGLTAEGNFVVTYIEYAEGTQNIYTRTFRESTNTAGPTVTSVTTGTGESLDDGSATVADGVTYVVVTVSEQMYSDLTGAGNDVTNKNNYVLRNSAGQIIQGGISAVYYGLNEAAALAAQGFSGLNATPSGKYEIVLALDGNGPAAGVAALGTGTYTLTLLTPVKATPTNPSGSSGLTDQTGAGLGATGYVTTINGSSIVNSGANYNLTFTLNVASDPGSKVGTEIAVNQTTPGVQTTSSTEAAQLQFNSRTLAVDDDGDFVVVWISEGDQDGDGAGVYMRLYNAQGQPLTNETRVNSFTAGNQTSCSVAMDADGDFVVVWASQGQDADGSWGIYGQRFDSMGRKVGAEFRVHTNTLGDQIDPSVAMDQYGNFVVAWTSTEQAGSNFYNTVRAQAFNSHGVKISAEIRVNDAAMTDVSEAHPQVGLANNGVFVVVWSAPTMVTNGVVLDTEVRGRRFLINPDNTITAGGEVTLSAGGAGGSTTNTSLRSGTNAQVAVNRADGAFAVVWQSYVSDAAGYDVFFSLFGANGAAVVANQQANLAPPAGNNASLYSGDQVNPSVSFDANGAFVITWNGNGAETNPLNSADETSVSKADTQGVWMHKYSSTGVALDTQRRVNLTSVGYQGLASVGMTAAGGMVVAWYGRGSGDVQGIFCRVYAQTSDQAGPIATDFLLPDGTPVADSGQVTQELQAIIVTFDEALDAATATNPANYALLINGVEIVGGISQAFYGLDVAYTLNGQYGINTVLTNKYQVVLIVDANGPAAGVQGLTDGQYQILVKNNVRDKAGNPLNSTGSAVNGGMLSGIIYVKVPTGQETCVANNEDDAFPTGQHTYDSTADAVASDADGDYVVVWTDTTAAGAGVWAQIYKQTTVINSDGTRTTGVAVAKTIRVSSDPTATDISVAMDADGDFVVTWSAESLTTSWDVYARMYNASGTALGNSFLVNTYTAGVQRQSAVAMDSDGDFVIVWQSLGQDGGGYGVYAQRYSPAGKVVAGSDEVQQLTFSSSFTGTFKIRWDDDGNPATPDKVTSNIAYSGNAFATAAAVQAALQAIGADVTVEATSMTTLKITFKDTDGSKDQSLIWVNPSDVAAATGDPAAAVSTTTLTDGATGEFLVNDTTVGNQMYADVAMSAKGDFVVTWTSFGQDGDNALDGNIYAKNYLSNDVYYTLVGSTTSTAGLSTRSASGATGSENAAARATSVDAITNHEVDSTQEEFAEFAGVVQVVDNAGAYGSGSLLAGTSYILTAAHVVEGFAPADLTVWFDTLDGTLGVPVVEIFIHPDYDPNLLINDIALVRLAYVPAGVTGYSIYTGTDEVGQTYDMYGYGRLGTCATGETDDNVDNIKHTIRNRFDATGDVLGNYTDPDGGISTLLSSQLISDVDNGTANRDPFGVEYGIHDLGLGIEEGATTHGDSGGPLFIDGKIAAIVSYGIRSSVDIDSDLNSSFGEYDVDTRVSSFASWITTVIINGSKEYLVNANDAASATVTLDNQSGNQSRSSVAMDADGDFVIVWTSYGHDVIGSGYGPGFAGENGVFARRYAAGGTQASNVFQVNETAQGNQQNARVAMDADGDFVVAWESDASGASFDVYARFYARTSEVKYQQTDQNNPFLLIGTNPLYGANGEMGGEIRVNTTTNGDQRFPGVSMDHTGDAVIVWSGNGDIPGQDDNQGVFFQRFAKAADDAGPTVSQVQSVTTAGAVAPVYDGVTDVGAAVSKFIVTFGEDVTAATATNVNNWSLTLGGTVLAGAIAKVEYGLNMAYTLSLVSSPSGKYEAVVTFDGSSTQVGYQTLGQGTYKLTLTDTIVDLSGNKLDGNYDGAPGVNYTIAFTILGGGTAGGGEGGDPTNPADPGSGATDNDVTPDGTSGTVTLAGKQDSPAVAADAQGNYVLVWVQYDAIEGVTELDANIYAQLFDKTGKSFSNVFRVNTYTTGSQIEPAVAMDDFGNFVVVWSGAGVGDQTGIFATVYDRFGTVVKADIVVNQTVANIQNEPSVAMDSDGDFVVSWTSYGNPGGASGDVYVRCFNVQGTPTSAEIRANSTITNRQDHSDVAMDSAGNFVVVWETDQQDGNSDGIFGQRFSAGGAKLGAEFQVNAYTLNGQITPAVAMDSDGDFVVVWSSFGQDGSGYGVYGRRYNASGVAQTASEFRVNTTTLNWQVTPDVAMSAGGTFTVTWASFGQDNLKAPVPTYDYGIYARIFNPDGTSYKNAATGNATGEFRVNAITRGNQVDPAITVADNGRVVVAWVGPAKQPTSGTVDDTDIFSRIIVPGSEAAVSASAVGPTIGSVAVVESGTQPRDGTLTSAEKLTISWNVLDADGIKSTTVSVDGATPATIYGPYAAASGFNYSAPLGLLSAGTHTYVITATDNLGNVSTFTGTFEVVAAAAPLASNPIIGGVVVVESGAQPKDGTFTSAEKLTISWNVADADGVAASSIKLNGTALSKVYGPYAAASGVNYSSSLGALPAGIYTYEITASDKLGNVSTYTGTFEVVPAAAAVGPTISGVAVVESGTQPKDGTLTSAEKLTISWNLVSANGIQSTSIKVDNVAVTKIYGPYAAASGFNYSAALGTRTVGTHTYVITATDTLGNVSTLTGTFKVVAASSSSNAGKVARSAVFASAALSRDDSAKLAWLYDFDAAQEDDSVEAVDAVLAAY